MNKPIRFGRKKKARELREGKGVLNNPDGTVSTHRMATYTGEGNKHYVAPTIAPDETGTYNPQSFSQAAERGEVFQFRRERRARKFAYGGWKKGKDRREAMKAFRKRNK